MKTQKFVLRTIYCLAGLLLLLSLGFNIYQYQRNKELFERPVSENITKIESVDDWNSDLKSPAAKMVQKSAAALGKVEKSDTGEIKELEYHLNAAKEELDMINEQLSEDLSEKAEFGKAWHQLGSKRSDPVSKEKMRDAATKRTDEDYDPLFKKLNISGNKFDGLKGMLFNKVMERYGSMELYANATDDKEKEKVLQQERDIVNNYMNKIAEFLGEEKNEIYQSYENRLPERRRLNDFMVGLSPDNRINEEQRESLIDSMYDARKAVYDEMDTDKNESSSELTEGKITQSIVMQSRIHEKYVEAGGGIMSPEQSEQFKTYLKQQLEMQEALEKMSLYFNEKK